MYNNALRIVNNSGEAEDIMQNSFLDAFGKLETWHGTGTSGNGFNDRAETLALQEDGNILVGGWFRGTTAQDATALPGFWVANPMGSEMI